MLFIGQIVEIVAFTFILAYHLSHMQWAPMKWNPTQNDAHRILNICEWNKVLFFFLSSPSLLLSKRKSNLNQASSAILWLREPLQIKCEPSVFKATFCSQPPD